MTSIIKWAGGKKLLTKEILNIILKKQSNEFRYIDLFCGGLSVPLELMKNNFNIKFVLNDINTSLIHTYKTIQKFPNELIEYLKTYNSDEYNNVEKYNEIRKQFNIDKKNVLNLSIQHAAQFIYLNKRGYNGLYRENSKGEFNVPYRHSKTSIYDEKNILELHSYFNVHDIEFFSMSYETLPITFTDKDILYIDPPYIKTNSNSFTSYHSSGFNLHDQNKLKEYVYKLDSNNISFIVSNAPCQEIIDMYKHFEMKSFCIHRSMRDASMKKHSKALQPNEILISNIKFV